jgi:hypothetical protein
MRRQPVEPDFKIEVSAHAIVVHFLPTRSLYTFTRFTDERDIAEFGPLSPDPVIQHTTRVGGTRIYDPADVQALAFRLATAAARANS